MLLLDYKPHTWLLLWPWITEQGFTANLHERFEVFHLTYKTLYVLESKAILLDQFDNFFTCPIYLIFRETFSIVNVFFFQAHVWERLLPVQPQRDAASPLDGARESCRRPLHTHVWCLVLRGPALRNDHIRKFSIPRFKQQSGECRLISLFAVIDFFGNKFVDQFNFDVLKYLKHFNWILKVT